jgi:hypothetical protein
VDPSAPGWYPDPTGRHERRYWSGIRWSRHVDNGGERADDPIEPDSKEHIAVRTSGQVPQQPAPMPPSTQLAVQSRPPAYEQFGVQGLPPRRTGALVAGIVAIVVLGAGALFLTTRGDGTETDGDGENLIAETDENYEALLAHLTEYFHRATGNTITDEDAACMSRNTLGAITSKRMIEAGVLDAGNPIEVLVPDEVNSFVTAAYGCLDDEEAIAAMASTVGPGRDTWGPCLFRSLFEQLGRPRTIEYYASQAIPEDQRPTVFTPEEQTTFNGTISSCVEQTEQGASTTTTGG